jgi:hypothetical protein
MLHFSFWIGIKEKGGAPAPVHSRSNEKEKCSSWRSKDQFRAVQRQISLSGVWPVNFDYCGSIYQNVFFGQEVE